MVCVCLAWWVVLWCFVVGGMVWVVNGYYLGACGVLWIGFWCFGGLRRFVFFLDGGLDVSDLVWVLGVLGDMVSGVVCGIGLVNSVAFVLLFCLFLYVFVYDLF